MDNLFDQFSIDRGIVKALDEQGLTNPTPVQQEGIPRLLDGCDVVAQAPTGTGKTLAFILPAMMRVDRSDAHIQAIVLCPTRELVMQICEVAQSAAKYFEGLRCAGIYGGQNIQRQLLVLRKKPQIIVGTPGRVLDHIGRSTLKLGNVRIFVLDEGDEMYDMGFRSDIEKIMDECPKDCQKAVFSATLPDAIKSLIEQKLSDPVFIKTTKDGEDMPSIKQYFCMVKDSQRVSAMLALIERNAYRRAIVFCNTKLRAQKLGEALRARKCSYEVLHGDLKQNERTKIMKRFKTGEVELLIATDVAARGIDVDGVQAIINFDPPTDSDFYVHRIGRTARADRDGAAFTLITSEQTAYLQAYQKVTNNALEFLEFSPTGDSFTLPRDGSNRMSGMHSDSKRFFLNVGTRDDLDKETVVKLITSKTDIKIYQIADVKLRDNYSFVEINSDVAEEIKKLQGVTLGTRAINIEDAGRAAKPRDDGQRPQFKRAGSGRDGKRPYEKKPYVKRDGESGDYRKDDRKYDKKPYSDRTSGESKRSYEKKPYVKRDGESGDYRKDDRKYDKKPYSDRASGEGKRPYEKKPYVKRDGESGDYRKDDRKYDKKPYSDRASGEGKRPYEKKPYVKRDGESGDYRKDDRKYDKKPYSDRASGEGKRPYEKKPYVKRDGESGDYRKDDRKYDKKPYSDRASEGKRPYEKKPYVKRDGESGDYRKDDRKYDKKPSSERGVGRERRSDTPRAAGKPNFGKPSAAKPYQKKIKKI